MSIARRMIQCSLPVSAGNASTPYIQIPNGATKLTIQFVYSSLDDDIVMSMNQSLDGFNFDACVNEDDAPITITLDKDFTSMTLNVSDLLTTWIQFSMDVGEAKTGSLDKMYVIMT
ncbi:MAG: hypothetical protein WCO02_07440 [Bacteroidota bacterium]